MAAFEVIALDTATPQLRAPGASDTYTFPRAVEMPLGTANGVLFLNGSKVVTSGSGLVFDSSGNLGLGVTPSAWSGARAFQMPNGVFVSANSGTTTPFMNLGANAYFDGTNWIYSGSFAATRYAQLSGAHQWFTAPSGTAGNAISFTQAMTLDASGNLGIGTTNPSATLELARTSADVGLFITRSSTGAASYRQFIDGDGDIRFNMVSSKSIRFFTNNTERARIPAAGGMVVGTAALATSATDGFLYVPTCAGTPTGTPTTQTGTAPIVVDTTNNKLYFYSGGAWRDAGP